ncbi:MAG: diphthamide synthesis protein [Candidatus Parvarchaeota archaeon]|nr:diphthamide synthesis protein [Candidatus Parvarchaeota archaeon]
MKYQIKNEGLKYLTEKYDIDFDSLIDSIREKKYDKVAIQIPDGFKLHALDIADMISENSGAEVYIWGGSTYGACDAPIGLGKFGIKAVIQFGHARFRADELGKSSG